MTNCPFCQFRNEDGSLFCEQCKSDLSMVEAQRDASPAVAAVAVAPVAAVAVAAAEAVAVAAVPYEVMATPVQAVAVEAASAVPASMPLTEATTFPSPEPIAAAATEAFPIASPAFLAETMVAVAPPTADAILLPDVAPPPPTVPAVEIVPAPLPVVPLAAVAVPTEPAAVSAPPLAAPAPSASPAAAMQPKLVVTRGLKIGLEYTVYEGHNFVGRMDEKPVDIDLEDQESPEKVYCSRQHALVTFENGQLMIEDLNSANGTFVNRNRIYPGQSKPLQAGDVIQIGTVQMRVKL